MAALALRDWSRQRGFSSELFLPRRTGAATGAREEAMMADMIYTGETCLWLRLDGARRLWTRAAPERRDE